MQRRAGRRPAATRALTPSQDHSPRSDHILEADDKAQIGLSQCLKRMGMSALWVVIAVSSLPIRRLDDARRRLPETLAAAGACVGRLGTGPVFALWG